MGVANVPAASAAGLQPKYQKFTSSGTFTLPTGYGVSKPLLVNIQVIGGGGAGSGVLNNNNVGWTFVYNYGATNYFGVGAGSATYTIDSTAGAPGGSGGIAATQLYLTSNLTITVGAAGARSNTNVTAINWGTITSPTDNNTGSNSNSSPSWSLPSEFNATPGPLNYTVSAIPNGGSGGTSTAGAISATGGAGASAQNWTYNAFNFGNPFNNWRSNAPQIQTPNLNNGSAGAGGTPAGTAGDATPLLGTIAGGSTNTTSVKGSFGIGGVYGDAGTSTGVEGTGGGRKSSAASGAVILTWWE